jgi:hypothetical protein
MFTICPEDMKVRRGSAVAIDQRTVKGKIDLENGKMIVVLDDTIYRKDFLSISFSPDSRSPSDYPPCVYILGIDLPQPPGIPVARCP